MLKRTRSFIKKHRYKILGILGILLFAYYWCMPSQLFHKPTSTVLFDRNGELMGAKIAKDGQWRFPHNDSVPEKFKKAILTFEDKRFYSHWGVDPLALSRAVWNNVTKGRRTSGASTLTMQTIRLSKDNPSRTVWEKVKEIILATRIEWSYSKDEILAMYTSNAPFGGNVVGLDAAAWKYFGRSAQKLSWAESAMLAVLPNSPSLIHLSKNREKLKKKRNRLLHKLRDAGEMDSITCELAKLEELPNKPKPLPRYAPHLLEQAHKELVLAKKQDGIIRSTLDVHTQQNVNDILDRHYQLLRTNEIHNLAALVVNVETGDVVAYAGNVIGAKDEHSPAVDVIRAQRSSGSILKPFLYASMLHDGEILPNTIFPDIPSQFGGYNPTNFDESFSGAVPASKVITKSLNIPSVYMLKQYDITRFLHKLKKVGMTSLHHAANHYGLTLILGGAETKLWDLGAMYAGMSRNLKHFYEYNGKYEPNVFRPLNYLQSKSKGKLKADEHNLLTEQTLLNASSIWHTYKAMLEVIRPGEEIFWKTFPSAQKVAWKTGTSFGFRDAWAVGCTPQYVVAVWAGNADGEGRPGLVGVQAAAPVLFDIFNSLDNNQEWFEAPFDEMAQVSTCKHSGFKASEYCTHIDTIWVPTKGQRTKVCPYHKRIHLDKKGEQRVHSDCVSPMDMVHRNYFVLPPTQEWFYKKKHPSYKTLPPYRPDCAETLKSSKRAMALIYPQPNMKIYVPTNLDETKSRTVFEAKHRDPNSIIYWHVDNEYVGETSQFHHLELNPPVGEHLLTLVDESGESMSRKFEILAEE
ncbi:MAG: penicillin-binding protein 1C [Aureispira sp.]|nr:penicillin-binding protein 1C [Aureispira sp.]